jgi:hypothetical protein
MAGADDDGIKIGHGIGHWHSNGAGSPADLEYDVNLHR